MKKMKKKSLIFSISILASIIAGNVYAGQNTVANPINTTKAVASTTIDASNPDTLIQGIVDNVTVSIKQLKLTGSAKVKKISELIEEKIIPYSDLETTTKMTMGQHWDKSTPEQRILIIKEFKQLLVATYAGALTKVNDQQINYKPLRILPNDTKAIIKSTIIDQGDTKSLDYRLHKVGNEWRLYDINVLGIGLIASYKTDFVEQANKNGIDGLIKFLQNKNKKA